MTEFTSEVKTVPFSDAEIFSVLSDLSKLEQVKDKIPTDKLDKIKEFSYDKDSVTISVDPVGKIRFLIVERNPNQSIKFEAEQLPFAFNLWVNLTQENPDETKMQLRVEADLNMFIKPMLSKPLQEGLDRMADVLAMLPFDKI